MDGQAHSVQIYSDISAGNPSPRRFSWISYHIPLAEWVSGNRSNEVQWNTTQADFVLYHQAQRTTLVTGQENADIVEGSTVYYGMAAVRK
jgi:hypothetical protein